MRFLKVNRLKTNTCRALTVSIFAVFFAFNNMNARANEMNGANAVMPAEPAEISHIPIIWDFHTYAEPDFKAAKTGFFPPQSVFVVRQQEDGWALVNTYQGESWAYLPENKLYTENPLPLYDNKDDTNAISELLPQVVKITQREGDWLLIETWLGEKWINLNALRESVLLDVPSYSQRKLGYPTGCEIVSVAMMINYETPADVKELIAKMPRASDPNEGFRGEPTSEDGFSIFPPALLNLTGEYLNGPRDLSGSEIDDLKENLNAGRPIVVWVNGLGFNVHAVCLTGYNKEGFFYNDPWTGRKDSFISYASFYRIWDKPIFDRIYGESQPTRKALGYTK